MDMHQHSHNIVHFYFGLLLKNHGESNTEMTSVVIARAKGTGYSREKKSRPLYWNQVSYGWSPETHHIWLKSAQNRPYRPKNHEWVSAELSFFVKFWMKFDLWDCERKRFPPWVLIVWVGSTKIGTSCDVPDWVFGLYFRHFSFLIKSEKFRPRESQGLTNAVLKSGLLIAPPKIPWKITFFQVCRTLKKEQKNTNTFG